MNIEPVELIKALRETDPYITTIFTEGSCYQFHLFLKKFWPDAVPVIHKNGGHIGTLIDGEIYDIEGVINWPWKHLNEEELENAKQWSFAQWRFLQVGECPFCEEPLLA